MLRSTLLAFALPTIGITSAQLAPYQPATVGEHLLEVNAQWTSMDPSVLLDDARTVGYRSEADRIADHLHRVQGHLSTHLPAEVGRSAQPRRSTLLDALRTYADRGIFPMNDIAPVRSPVFIDALGNACAVGHLMIMSGHAELAERISKEMNLGYVHDITLPEVAEWATANGFTIDELAWIQPTYEHMKVRDPRLLASLHMTNGDQIIVQAPANAQAAQKLRLMRKEHTGDKMLTTLPLLSAVQAVEFAGRVFVSGKPPETGSSAEVYEWNGKSLVAHDPFPGRLVIGALFVSNGSLHVRGHALGVAEYQERYLTEAGEWRTVEAVQQEIAPIEVSPDELRVP